MTRYTKLTAVAAAALLAAPAFAAMTTDANLELDSTYKSEISQTPNLGFNRSGGLQQDGRVEFNIAGKAGDANGFVAGRASLLLQKSGGAATDDMWGQIGTGMADVKLGRFEAADMFPLGKDVLVEDGANPAGGSRTQGLRGRMGASVFHGALTVNPGSGLSFELGIVESKADSTKKGIRPVVSFAAGPVTVKVGFESGQTNGIAATPATDPAQKFNNFGVTVGGNLEGVGFNVSLGSGKVKDNGVDPEVKSTSFGANATFGPAGVGLIMDTDKSGGVKNKDTVIYAAYSIPLFNTGATLTPAISHQTGKAGSTSLDSATSLKVRLNYAF